MNREEFGKFFGYVFADATKVNPGVLAKWEDQFQGEDFDEVMLAARRLEQEEVYGQPKPRDLWKLIYLARNEGRAEITAEKDRIVSNEERRTELRLSADREDKKQYQEWLANYRAAQKSTRDFDAQYEAMLRERGVERVDSVDDYGNRYFTYRRKL